MSGSKTTKEVDLQEVCWRLDVVIRILLEGGPDGGGTMRGKILRLKSFGLTDAQTAAVIGKPPKYVTAVKAAVRTTVKSSAAKPASE